MLTRANKVVETRDVTWEAPPVMVVPPVQVQRPASPKRQRRRSWEGRRSREGHQSWERLSSREGWMISILIHRLHYRYWGEVFLTSVG